MYVCICRAVKESRIRTVVAAGADSVDAVEASCGAGGDCGSCREEIQGIILEVKQQKPVAHQCNNCEQCPNQTRSISTQSAA